ncbi:MAG: nuclear transport factor 2 family protein [Rubrivivax sp.]|jgi:ketosteroid isomerase-like protein
MNAVDVLAAYLRAYEAKDLDAVADLLTDDVCLQDWHLVARGKPAVLAETRRNFADAEHLQIDVLQFYEGPGCAAATLHIVVNRSVELDVVDTVVTTPDGKISAIRAYKA